MSRLYAIAQSDTGRSTRAAHQWVWAQVQNMRGDVVRVSLTPEGEALVQVSNRQQVRLHIDEDADLWQQGGRR